MNLANPSPGPGRLYQFIEPPSNQRSCVDNVSKILQEEEKAYIRLFPYIITKFSCTFSNVFVCLFLCYFHRLSWVRRGRGIFSQTPPRKLALDQSQGFFGVFFFPWFHSFSWCTKNLILMCYLKMLRELKHNRSLDMRLISTVQDSGTMICNPISIDSPTSITRDFNVQVKLISSYLLCMYLFTLFHQIILILVWTTATRARLWWEHAMEK